MNFPLRATILPGVGCFRLKLLGTMMFVAAALTAAGLFLARRNAAAEVARDLRREFQGELVALHTAQEVRHAALAERCRALARNPRIHAALEDDALDLLYPSARDELRDVMRATAAGDEEPRMESSAAGGTLHARFYRFLDANGAVIPPPDASNVGALRPEEEARLALPALTDRQQIGYLVRRCPGQSADAVEEIMAVPIFSSETGEVIAALVLGFKLTWAGSAPGDAEMERGVWLDDRLHPAALGESARSALHGEVTRAIATPGEAEENFEVPLGGTPHLLFSRCLNPGSRYAPAHEVCFYPLTGLRSRQRELTWRFLGIGTLLLLGGLGISHVLSGRLAMPVERLAVDSAQNRAGRQQAEARLELTSAELQRAARFSSDASHQLKTPVTVLRAGLEELLLQDHLSPEQCEEVSALVHQTYRLTGIVEDLLLLSRMDAGRLQLDLRPVNLVLLLEALLDDLSARPEGPEISVETDLPPCLAIAGEKRYTAIILQNLLENARKYNVPDGRIRVTARREDDGWVIVRVGNTGAGIPPAAQEHVFERFHRGAAGENVPGHGLGLNLARELARLHGGELSLVCSEGGWTEFEVRFRLAAVETPIPSPPLNVSLRGPLLTCLIFTLPLVPAGLRAQGTFDRVEEALKVSLLQDRVRLRASGLLDLEYYRFPQRPPGLILAEGHNLFNPRLSLFLDGQLGPRFYLFAQARADRGFDPDDNGARTRLDEIALRWTPWEDGRVNLQVGKFPTVVGNWVARHLSWDNPFVNAPLPYENLTAIEDKEAPASAREFAEGIEGTPHEYNPVVWGPSYATGIMVSGRLGRYFDYAAEAKNSALSSRPEAWDSWDVGFDHPTFSARLGFRPDQAWNLGLSASRGPYFRPEAEASLPRGRGINDYPQYILGQDFAYARHHLQLWAECYEARFEVPRVGSADTFAYYGEARYKFTPQLSGALRWNQQLFGDVPDGEGGQVPWGRNLWRVDTAGTYRFTEHLQLKLQYSLEHERSGPQDLRHTFAGQFTVRF